MIHTARQWTFLWAGSPRGNPGIPSTYNNDVTCQSSSSQPVRKKMGVGGSKGCTWKGCHTSHVLAVLLAGEAGSVESSCELCKKWAPWTVIQFCRAGFLPLENAVFPVLRCLIHPTVFMGCTCPQLNTQTP